MQPNDQQGYTQPTQDQPVQPVQPVMPAPVETPVQPVAAPLQPVVTQTLADTALQASDVAPQSAAADDDDDDDVDDEAPVAWNAYEYIHHEKGTAWFVIFGTVAALVFGAAIYFQQWLFAVLIVVIVAVIIVSSRRPPRQLAYALDDEGLAIDGVMHPFENFKAFGVIRDGAEYSVMLIPTQRFQPAITVYFPEEAGEAIVDMLGARLPMKDLHLDAVDRVVRFLRLQ